MGFSAEKDRDRHFHDKHDKDAPRQKCHYNCSYSSPRESNVKQHMEKAHGYIYVRTKTVQKSKSPATPAKSTTRGNVAPRRPRQDRQTSSSQPPPSVTSSVQNTPVVMDSKYPSSDSTPSPLFDIDTLSPETLREEPSPALESVQSFFPPLPKSPNSLAVISPRFINQTLDAQHQMADTFEPSPHHSLFTDPPGALEAMRMQQNSGDEVPSYPHMNVMHWGFGPIAKTDPPLGGESPDSDFADNFLRDAPDSIMNQLGASAPFDPELPVVTNSVYDESRDMFLG
jgi:hypothetical protein